MTDLFQDMSLSDMERKALEMVQTVLGGTQVGEWTEKTPLVVAAVMLAQNQRIIALLEEMASDLRRSKR